MKKTDCNHICMPYCFLQQIFPGKGTEIRWNEKECRIRKDEPIRSI